MFIFPYSLRYLIYILSTGWTVVYLGIICTTFINRIWTHNILLNSPLKFSVLIVEMKSCILKQFYLLCMFLCFQILGYYSLKVFLVPKCLLFQCFFFLVIWKKLLQKCQKSSTVLSIEDFVYMTWIKCFKDSTWRY